MQIPSTLPRFENKTALIIITGTEEAKFAIARDQVIGVVFEFKLEKIRFSDREDSARHGKIAFETNNRAEEVKKINHQNFIKNFKDGVRMVTEKEKIDHVYLFAPNIITKELERALTAPLKKKLRKTYIGNFCKETMLNILKKIKTELGK